MEENIKILLDTLNREKDNIIDEEDNKKIMYLCESLTKIEKEIPKLEELEIIEKIEKELEIEYEQFYELGNYFDPICIGIKKTIHDNEVKKLREENRRKRGN